jgi:hypothetical protein
MEILDQANSANHLGQISSLARRSVQAISEASYTETGDSVDSGGDIQSTASAEDVARSNAVTKKRIRGLKDR